MNKSTLSIASLLIATLASTSAFALDAKSVAAVNGKQITQEEYQEHLKQRAAQSPNGQQAPVNRQLILDDLINREILLQEAKNLKLQKDKNVLKQIEQAKSNILIQAVILHSPASQPVTDKELKEVYDQQVGAADPTEYKARHILLKDEATAKELIKKLNDGADFEEMAKKESTGPSGPSGGDLGWFSAEKMVPEFSQATSKMKKGTHSQTPVKTQFGYHIIKLEDSRKRELPKFEDVKNQIKPIVQNNRIQEYLEKLRSKAKIEIK
jgi:peptidyl-prolyl cis-trans isomerase C